MSTPIRGALRRLCCSVIAAAIALPALAEEQKQQPKRIEEVVVYGQRTEATVSDTSISITAMSEDFLETMGIQGPNEMVNFIPATTRTDWDVKIRGVGRNFRGLGGDPGVGTYYNGIYSPDFGIASTEGGLYDIKRIEVLRGPQGTLYGRNSVGGVINYVTNQPNHEGLEGNVRAILGSYNRREIFGVVSGPITDTLAMRLTGSQRLMDGWMKGLGPAPDVEDIDDRNVAIILDWNITDKLTANVRFNDRRSDRMGNFGNGGHGILSEGPCIGRSGGVATGPDDCDPQYRVGRDTNYYSPGLRVVDEDFANAHGAFPYPDPFNPGETIYASYLREGVDPTIWPFGPSPNYHDPWVAKYGTLNSTTDKTPHFKSLTNGFVNEQFDHQATTLIVDFDASENLSFKYLGNYQWFEYWFDRDNDFSASELSSVGDTVIEAVWSLSHELRAFWNLGDRWTATSGVYFFRENRLQHYGIRNRLAKGMFNNPTQYGPDNDPTWLNRAFPWFPGCFDWQTAPIGAPGGYGAYCGDPGVAHDKRNDVGAMYEHINEVTTDNLAIYTQGDLQLTDKLSLTLGVRWSQDKRNLLEQRGGYSEILTDQSDASRWVNDAIAATADPSFGDTSEFQQPYVTPLAAINVGLGAATFTGDPEFPIAPTCDLESTAPCTTPLRLGGLPIAWGSRARGKYPKDDRWSYRINFNYEPTPDMLIYAGVTTSYRAGGFNAGCPDCRATVDGVLYLSAYKPEELVAWEIGYKGTHLDGRLQISGGLYYYDYKNYQDEVETWESTSGDFALPPGIPAPAGRGPVDVVTNIPKSTNVGAEADITWLATDNLSLGGNYSYTVSEWKQAFTIYNQYDPRFPREVVGGDVSMDPCSEPDPQIRAIYCINVDGRQLAGIPKHKGTLWGSYQFPVRYGTFTLYTSVALTGSYYSTALQRPWDRVPARSNVDMRLTFVESGGRWEAHVFVDNVFDTEYVRWSDMEPRRSGYGIIFPQRTVALEPRSWGAEFTWRFGMH
ncbi:MAG: TonB-dependent receptor [Pseudomonadales bacterium]|jgi:outer membrane receptor protein involved in Fe transport